MGRDILLTDGDIIRIARATGRSDFQENRRPVDSSYLDQDDDPSWNRMTVRPDGTRRVIRRQPGEKCHFLGQSGCLLDIETRPLVCRLHPFSYNHKGLTGMESDCPVSMLDSRETLLSLLGMDMLQCEEWRRLLYLELTGAGRYSIPS